MPPARATVEDYDSEENSVVPGTAVEAAQSNARRSAQQSARPQKPVARSKSRAPPVPPASDSGYSSHASAPAQATTKSPAPARVNPSVSKAVQPPVAASPTNSSKPKPQIHRIDSARSTRAQTVSQDTRRCSDRNCVDPDCGSLSTATGSTERRYTLPNHHHQQQRPQATPQQHISSYPQQSYSQYSQPPAMQPPPPSMMPPPAVQRARCDSMSRTRPVSIHGYASMSYAGAQVGPSPSASAYYAYSQPSFPQQPLAYRGAVTVPPQQTMDYTPASPGVPPSPSSPPMSGYPGFSGTYISARQGNPNVPGLEMPKSIPQPGISLVRTMSARHSNERVAGRRSSTYIEDPESADSYSDSAAGSESESESDSEYWRQLRRRNSRRESRNTQTDVVPGRRPSISGKKYISDSTVPRARRESRLSEITRTKTSQSDNLIEYPSSSDLGDSDKTQRAVIHGRDSRDSRNAYADRSSRRPSVSSKGSSVRTKPSSVSSVTDYSRVIIEDSKGRRTAYLSKSEQADLIRRYQQQKLEDKVEEQQMRRDKIEAYQRATSGEAYDLTAENIKKHSDRKTKSRVSGRSERSSGSGSKMTNDGKCVKLESNGTVLHIYGESKIEVRSGEDGASCFVIGSATGRESSYMGSSKGSSNSRVGRSRGRREVIREEYEPAL